MAAPQASSRLELLQARFQQKQLQEKEQKLLQLYDQQQQRAYQVVQRGSAGSNGSSYGSSVSQHTITKTSTNSHTTSTSQGGKVRQMFDERRQTTVKGIDRSYPLEPLENKPRKQTNGNVQKNGNSSVNRHSVTVKRVARADVNSNLNAGKPIVSYHEEITRESFGPSSGRRQSDDDEFGNENHVSQYANGNHRDEIQIEEVLDEDAIERNRMMAKLHLMQYDETLKHRIKNDLESEEFPEDFMVDVPDKLPKQSISKKLSQAEARLERFRNANAKRISNATKNTSSSQVPKKRAEPGLPGKAASSKGKTRNASERLEEMLSSSDSERTVKRRDCYEEKGQFARLSSDSSRNARFRSSSPKFFCKESEQSATTYAIDSKTGVSAKATRRLSPDFSSDRSRSGSPRFFCNESEKSATTYAIDSKSGLGSKTIGRSSPDHLKDRRSRSGSPRFFGEESGKSATTYGIDSKAISRSSPDFSKDARSRSGSPRFFCKESEKSATTYAIDAKTGLGSKNTRRLSPDFSSDRSRSGSPRFFCKESEKSATTYAIDPKSARRFSDFSSDRSRSGSPRFFCKESEKSATTYAIDSKAGLKAIKRSSPDFSRDRRSQSGSPKFFCKESDRSATTYAIDSKSKKKLAPDLSKNRSTVKIEPESEFINKSSRKSPVTTDDTVDRYIIDHDLDKVRTPSPTGNLKNYTSHIKIDGKIDSKLSRTGSPNIFERLTRDRSSSPQFSHRESRKSPISVASTKIRDFISKSPDRIYNILKTRDPRTTTSKSPDFAKTLRKSNASPQYSSDKSATIMFVTPETITRTKAGYSKPIKKAQSPTLSISKADVTNRMIDSRRRESVENIDESSKQRIRSSVSRYFEQCEKASRNEEARARNSVQKSRGARNADACRVSSPVSLKHMEAVSPVHKSPKLYREAPGKFIATNVVRSRSGTPEFFCYETDKMATTVSLKPRPGASPEPVRSESRLSKSSDTYATIKNVNDSSRSNSPLGTGYMTDKDKRILDIFPSKSEQPKCSRHSKSPLPTNKFTLSKGKSSKRSDVFNIDKDRKSISPSRRSTPSASPEFFCYETDKMATTVSLKPRPSKDSRDYLRSPEPLRSESILSKSPDTSIKNIHTSRSSSPVLSQYFSSKTDKPDSPKDLPRKHSKSSFTGTYSKGKSPKNSNIFNLPKDTKSNSRSHNASPSPHKGSRSPDFFCYETEKSATTVSLRASSKSPESSGLAYSLSKGRSSKSPEQSTKDSRGRRGSGNVLRSTRLIRDIIKHQRNRESDCAPWRDTTVSGRKERVSSSVGDVELKQRSKIGSNRNVVDRATTPTTSSRCKLPGESSPKRGTSAEMNSAIHEITMTDQYTKPDRVQLRGTYSKSSKTSSNSRRLDTFQSSLTKQTRNKRPPLDSTIFSSSKRDQRLVESRKEIDSYSEKTTMSCNSSESVFREKKRRTVENSSESLRSGVQTASLSRQSPTLGSIELVRKVMKSGTRAPDKTLKTREAEEQEGTQRRPSISVSGAAAVNDGRSSSKNYERTDSVESALRRFDSIDTEAGVESVQGTLQGSVTEKRQTPEESKAEGSADDFSTISLKALEQDADSPGVERESSATRLKRTSGTPVASRALKKEEDRRRKKITKITDPSEITGRVRSLTCRRRLFQDNDLETRSLRKIGPKSGSKKANKPSTGALDSDPSLSVKQLRSIEDIRRSFGDISSDREEARAKSAIASNASRARSGKPRVSSSVACDRIGKESLAKRSENVGASRDSERFVKSATRFSRVVKSPSLDSTKVVETNSRTRRSVLSPSKSPDMMVTRRPSTELKASDTRSTKRTTPTKDAEPIGKRKTTTTTTTTRKSTDAVDGATVLENGLHLQDQTVETKYDNDPQTAKKTFVIDYEEQPPKENNGPLPRKPLLKKPSIEKQTPSTPMQASTSNTKSKMTLRAKTTNVSSSSRSSASSKSGSNCTPDLLVPCKICGRSFAQDRVTLHEQICSKTGQKRRKLFDSVMSRVKGTELEKFVRKGCAKKQPEKPAEPKTNWRRKHEDFINAIRSAKQVQAHLAAGGKLSDLPPPPPSDTSDYVQCPHCGRKFNKPAAERHIPKCENMLHNKPIHSRAPKPRR
ncbi:uncharacterized protein LOC143213702 isoform X2 [Lasioglossum baleicum]|uniref:uncharacterized protein LOC143213702 isoform X2 n=1 Tax=Lasioglossum baleicum TaxID=434251 RepID=UPI003FCDA560